MVRAYCKRLPFFNYWRVIGNARIDKKLGIGTDPSYKFHLVETLTSATGGAGAMFDITLSPTAATFTGQHWGAYFNFKIPDTCVASQGSNSDCGAFNCVALHDGTGKLNNFYGFKISTQNKALRPAGDKTAINNMYGFNSEVANYTDDSNVSNATASWQRVINHAGANIANAKALSANIVNDGGGTTTNATGLNINISAPLGTIVNKEGIKTDYQIDADAYEVGNVAGKDGSFTTADGKTVTVSKGIITSIV